MARHVLFALLRCLSGLTIVAWSAPCSSFCRHTSKVQVPRCIRTMPAHWMQSVCQRQRPISAPKTTSDPLKVKSPRFHTLTLGGSSIAATFHSLNPFIPKPCVKTDLAMQADEEAEEAIASAGVTAALGVLSRGGALAGTDHNPFVSFCAFLSLVSLTVQAVCQHDGTGDWVPTLARSSVPSDSISTCLLS